MQETKIKACNEVLVPEPGNSIFKYLIESKKIATKGIEDLCGHLNHVVMCSVSLQSDSFVLPSCTQNKSSMSTVEWARFVFTIKTPYIPAAIPTISSD